MMNNKSKIVVSLLKDNDRLINFIEDNDFDTSDWYNDNEELADILSGSEAFSELEDDLMALCEDNVEMRNAIKEYFNS